MGKPKIRFHGYTEDWEQRKLGELGVTKSGIGFPDTEQGGTEGVPFFKVSDMNIEGNENELVTANNYVTDEQISRKRWNVIDDVPAIFFAKVGAAVMLNRKRLVRLPFLLDNNTMAYIFDKNVWDCDFGKTLFETIDLTKLTQVGALPSYNASDIDGIEISFPKRSEQEALGIYFRHLDHLITLHQRKCEETKTLKKYMLQKMFPKDGESTPEIRFSGFTDAWEQCKLGELVERVTRKNQDLVSELPLTISAQYGLVDQNEFFDKRVASKDVSGYYLILNGEFAYNKSTSIDAPWGAIKRLDSYENGVLSTLYIVFRIKDETEIDSDFLVSYYTTNLWYRGIHEIAAEGARNHGLLNIAPTDFFETKLTVPKDVEEQNGIGQYFKKLDTFITLHQHKCEELQNLKKFMLQNMFP